MGKPQARDLEEENVDLLSLGVEVNTKWLLIWRGVNAFMSLFFGLATAANVNDSDWYLWVPIYLVPTVLCLVLVINPIFSETNWWRYTALFHFILCLAYVVYLIVVVIEIIFGKKVNPLIHEEGREFFGLLIVMAWLAVCRFTPFGKSTQMKGTKHALLLVISIIALLPLVMWSFCVVEDWGQKFGHCHGMFVDKEL
ncbi:transmembrane protein 220-like [Liolophura sinensis]|uniref:transmembrane protein 220-like n=1 Tax=Liolophura sinensis TaxID=3198878 RepID=UPI0031591D1C